MSAARFLGYDRVTAARFSLLLSLPTIAGAGLLKTLGLAWLAIRWMMRWLTTAGFGIFVYYRLALGGLLLLALTQGWVAASII